MEEKLISVEAAVEALLAAFAFHSYAGPMAANVIRQLPTIDSRHGEWIDHEDGRSVYCSQCGEDNDYRTYYCPNCGADMRKVTE